MAQCSIEILQYEVMQMLLTGDDPTLNTLRLQYQNSSIKNIEKTGSGFFVNYLVASAAKRVEILSFEIGDVEADVDGLRHGAGFVLFIRDGTIDFLEGYSYDEPWPNSHTRYRLSYNTGEIRDFVALRRQWDHE